MDNISFPRTARNTLTALAVAAGITTGLNSCSKIDVIEELEPEKEVVQDVPSKTEKTGFRDKLLNTKEFLGVYNTSIGDAEIDLETGERFYQFYNKDASNDSTKVYKDLFIEWNGRGHDGVGVIRDVKGTKELDVVHKYDSPDSTKLNSHHRVFLNEGGDTLFIANPKTKEVLATVVKSDDNKITVTKRNGEKATHEFFTDGNVIPPVPITFDPSVDGWENVDNNVDL